MLASHSTYMLCLFFSKRHFFLCLTNGQDIFFWLPWLPWAFLHNSLPKGFQPPAIPNPDARRETAGKSKALKGPSCLRASQELVRLQPGERNAPTKNVDAPTPLKINQHCKWDIMEVWKFIFLSFHG